MKKQQKRSSGVALIMALSVILLLSVALMKSFENRTVETLLLENSLQRFQAETLSRSVLRAILVGLKKYGLLALFKNQQRWKGFPIPLNETQYFQIQTIESLDHRFNLNRRYRFYNKDGDEDPWLQVFHNIINSFPGTPYEKFETTQFYSALNDWSDFNQEQDVESNDNYEGYPDANPQFEVKDRWLDRLSEVKLIPSFHDPRFAQAELEKRFRIYPIDDKDSEKIALDVNLASIEGSIDSSSDVRSFLAMFKDSVKFPKVYDSTEAIMVMLNDRDEELSSGEESELNFLTPTPRYKKKKDLQDALDNANLDLKPEELELFSIRTHLLLIRFSLTSSEITVFTKAIVKVTYAGSNKDPLAISGFEILELTTN